MTSMRESQGEKKNIKACVTFAKTFSIIPLPKFGENILCSGDTKMEFEMFAVTSVVKLTQHFVKASINEHADSQTLWCKGFWVLCCFRN